MNVPLFARFRSVLLFYITFCLISLPTINVYPVASTTTATATATTTTFFWNTIDPFFSLLLFHVPPLLPRGFYSTSKSLILMFVVQ